MSEFVRQEEVLSSTAGQPLDGGPAAPETGATSPGQEFHYPSEPLGAPDSGQGVQPEVVGPAEPEVEVPERSFQRPKLTGPRRGRRLTKPEDQTRPAFTAQQRLLVFDPDAQAGQP